MYWLYYVPTGSLKIINYTNDSSNNYQYRFKKSKEKEVSVKKRERRDCGSLITQCEVMQYS